MVEALSYEERLMVRPVIQVFMIATLIVAFNAPVWADFESASKAYDEGEYETAFREFKALAE